ncbi:ATP-binding protein [Pseudotenacibaculum sp. MALMAid0570]|uniref:sensor histidine kinase n=1 Tax=Pseudotenacibaculum sp. MALMAid0570 TaxID=3143938 RepID=UPI0032DE76B7
MGNARKIAHDLLPPILEKFGLESAIEELVDEYNMSKKVNIKSNIEYPKGELDKTQELHVFRVFQELINNSVRHGKSKNIALDFVKNKEDISIDYKDDGVGFSQEIIDQKKGLGMKNIESRVELLNGELIIQSAIDEGIKVSIIF